MQSEEDERQLRRLEALARILDTVFRLPGTNVRIGADPLLGLIPGIGDGLGAALSSYIIYQSARMGAPVSTLLRMVGNVVLELLVGTIPVLGDLFDIAWKANIKNLNLLHAYLKSGAPRPRSSRHTMRLLLGALILLVIAITTLTVMLLTYLYRLLCS